MEELANVAPNRCKTSLAPIYGLQSEPSPALHLPLSSLLRSLLEDTNLALSKFVEDQTVHGFLPVLGRRHQRYYRTSSSFPGPYTVPPGLASITLDKVSESQKRSVSLSHSQVSSLETMLSSVCEVTSWLAWWLSSCGGFREQLTDEARGNFKWLMLSGSSALEFLGNQGITTPCNLVLFRRDSLLLDAQSTVPTEEVTRLRYAGLPSSPGIFPSPLLGSALNKMHAASNDAFVQQTLHPPKIPRKSSSGTSKAGSSSTSSADSGGVSPVVPRSQQQALTAPPNPLPSGVGSGGVAKARHPFRQLRPLTKRCREKVLLLQVGGLSVSALGALANNWSRFLGVICPAGQIPHPLPGFSSPLSHPDIVSDLSGRISSITGLAPGGREDVVLGCL